MLYNNARTQCVWGYGASDTSIVVNTGEAALFPTVFPFDLTFEHYESWVVTKREIITVTNITGDILTITRASETCVQDESASPKVRANNAYSFADWDFLSQYITEDAYNLWLAKKDEVRQSSLTYSASTTWTDAYEITISWITTYTDWLEFKVKADVANTGACTLNINGLWAKAVKKQQWTVDLDNLDWWVSWIATLIYNSTLDVFEFEGQLVNIPASYPSNIYVSEAVVWVNNTVFTFTHNLWLTEADVISWRYKVFLAWHWQFRWHQFWDTFWDLDYWGSTIADEWEIEVWNYWDSANANNTVKVNHQTNSLNILLWSNWSLMSWFRLLIQQVY